MSWRVEKKKRKRRGFDQLIGISKPKDMENNRRKMNNIPQHRIGLWVRVLLSNRRRNEDY